MTEHYVQPELPLEWPEPAAHFTIEVRAGPQFHEETIRTMEAKTAEDAVIAIESLRETYAQRNEVKWAGRGGRRRGPASRPRLPAPDVGDPRRPPAPRRRMSEVSRVEFARLEARVEALEAKRPGRKALPIVVKQDGVCGVDPERDSATCPNASLWRRQKGCLGTACVREAAEYFDNYRKAKRS